MAAQEDDEAKRKLFEKKLDVYRENYFLDPKGSNAETFYRNAGEMLARLLAKYTHKDFDVKIDFSEKGDSGRVSIIDTKSREDIMLQVLDDGEEMPYAPRSVKETMDKLVDDMSSEVCFTHTFMGQMHPHDNILSFVAGIAGKFMNGNSIAEEVSRVTTYKELQVVNWIGKEFGYTPDWGAFTVRGGDKGDVDSLEELLSGNITSGGTSANFAALLVARNKAYPGSSKYGEVGVSEDGLFMKNEGVIFGSEFSHYSLEKLCGYAGIGSSNFKKVKTRGKKMIVGKTLKNAPGLKDIYKTDELPGDTLTHASLRDMMWETAKSNKKVIGVFATAGTTETGNIDKLDKIADLVDEFESEFGYRPHFHVDAAHGGGFIFHDGFKDMKFKGIERADSITIDPHKMLYTHYNAGMILFRNKEDHMLLKQTADYLFKKDGIHNFGEKRIEGSMGLEGALQTWASLYGLGKEGFQTIQEHTLQMTQYLADKLLQTGLFKIHNEIEMNLVCFSYEPRNGDGIYSDDMIDTINKRAQSKMYTRGVTYISNDGLLIREEDPETGKTLKERKGQVFRACVMHPWTTKEDVDLAVDEVKTSIIETLEEMQEAAYISLQELR